MQFLSTGMSIFASWYFTHDPGKTIKNMMVYANTTNACKFYEYWIHSQMKRERNNPWVFEMLSSLAQVPSLVQKRMMPVTISTLITTHSACFIPWGWCWWLHQLIAASCSCHALTACCWAIAPVRWLIGLQVMCQIYYWVFYACLWPFACRGQSKPADGKVRYQWIITQMNE